MSNKEFKKMATELMGEVDHRADHYARLKPQPIEYMQKSLGTLGFRGYCLGNIIKYALRYGHKDNVEKEAAKIADYARWLYENEQGKAITV